MYINQQCNCNYPKYSVSDVSFRGGQEDYAKLREDMAKLSIQKEEVIPVKEPYINKLKKVLNKTAKFWKTQSKARKITMQSILALLLASGCYLGGFFTRPAKIAIQEQEIEIKKHKIETLDNELSAQMDELSKNQQTIEVYQNEIDVISKEFTEKTKEVANIDSKIKEKTQYLKILNNTITERITQNQMLAQQQSDLADVNLQISEDEQASILAEINSSTPVVKKSFDYSNIDVFDLCKDGNLRAVKNIVDNNPDFDINASNINGRSYMYRAIDNDKKGSHKELINYLASIPSLDASIPHANGHNDMYYMCVGGYDEAVQIYFDNHPDFDVNNDDFDGWHRSYMYRAIKNDRNGSHRKLINVLAGAPNLDANKEHQNGHTDMYYLCENGYTEAVKIYLDKHPEFDINKKDSMSGKTYIDIAQKNKHNDIVNILIEFQMKKTN